ncbi:phosphoethanolamine--lipid A transferase [Acidovorax sp. PRC11]|nr:phosphoethanolamine--lipid A transferase [Acidovorax sp. PRC11]MDT0138243.1 phosphoethanolamine--lipid A transferase [Acidovorax sp. PRC11]
MATESLVLWISVYVALAYNGSFLRATTTGRSWEATETWFFVGALVISLIALHGLIFSIAVARWSVRPLLTASVLVAAFATFYMQRYGVYYDPSMLRNVLRTDTAEASELISWSLIAHVSLYSAVPLWAIWRVRLTRTSLWRAVLRRIAFSAFCAVAVVAAVLLIFQDFSALMRNQKELRYLITPANVIYSTARVLSTDAERPKIRQSVGLDARVATPSRTQKPKLLFIVVGETVRASNWGLNGYERQTTPNLQALNALNFGNVTACGTDTETSLPCMFSAIGRRDYDEARIRSSESLLHVLARAGIAVHWKDNQSGCKGVCDDLSVIPVDPPAAAGLCSEGRCLDEALLHGLESVAEASETTTVVVLHMLGNHGPAYFKRYPAAFRRFEPTCDTGELRKCDRQSIVNAYDNAVLYTDHVLGQAVAFLKRQESRFDTAMLYVSDHGESLGEKGLFLHGLPRAIAPDEQTKVPMVWWLSDGFKESRMINSDCLKEKSPAALSHDNLFHSVLGLLGVSTQVYEQGLDISAACRPIG